ncbi:unnamed protein product [Adineta steineri]|uniref:MACPF domain-containing protein n=1 Tax=Adineta steineri TaxID=433720 RepID=A0A814J677_9BILA|nr:unnamed protein product [Adineta steineri]CAF1067578.1 unnamed protein product [Adineta steineri]
MNFKTIFYCLFVVLHITDALPVNFSSDQLNIDWLINSNKIALGYNPSRGNPICYSGDCVMKGFGAPVFKLQYTKRPIGSCLEKLLPEHIEVTCIPASEVNAKTEKISTFYEYKESYSKSESSGVNLGIVNFGSSDETSWMLDNIYKYNYTMYYTYVRMSFVKLMLFAPRLDLTEEFQAVIAAMPCCHIGCETTESYIQKSIFDQFGYTYLNEILLGGVAQQLITINSSDIEKIYEEGHNSASQAGVSFGISFGMTESESHNKGNHTKFMKYVQNVYASTAGGQPFDNSIQNETVKTMPLNEWFTTVPNNPVITQMRMTKLSELLTKERFPNDTQIEDKARLIELVWAKYDGNQALAKCVNDCTSPCHGRCVSTGYFQFGLCVCQAGFTGHDCSIRLF